MNKNILISILFIAKFYASNCVDLKHVYHYDCRSIIPASQFSTINEINGIFLSTYNGTCANSLTSPVTGTTYNATLSDGSVAQITRNPTKLFYFEYNGLFCSVGFGFISGACNGDVYARVSVYPLADYNRCVAGQCILTELNTKYGYFIVIGSGCGTNICTGSVKNLFPAGLE